MILLDKGGENASILKIENADFTKFRIKSEAKKYLLMVNEFVLALSDSMGTDKVEILAYVTGTPAHKKGGTLNLNKLATLRLANIRDIERCRMNPLEFFNRGIVLDLEFFPSVF